jgi:hypothetical protein
MTIRGIHGQHTAKQPMQYKTVHYVMKIQNNQPTIFILSSLGIVPPMLEFCASDNNSKAAE